MHVYCILNTLNGKRYIGLTTVSVRVRWQAHVSEAFGGAQRALSKAIRKYGAEAFVVETILSMAPGTTWDDLCAMERLLIAQEGTFGPGGYNMTVGGEMPAPPTAETKAKRSASLTGKKASQKALENLRASQTPERKAATSAKLKGRKLSPEHVVKLKASYTPERLAEMAVKCRHVKTPEARAKISAAWTPERRASESLRRAEMNRKNAKPHSEATKAKISAAQTPEVRAAKSAYWAARREAKALQSKDFH